MGKRIVIALGGNALGKNLHEQMDAVHVTAKAIADLIQDGHEVVIAHGNGPQVGMIQNAFAAYHKQEAKSDIMPLSMCVAMSQGYIGYDLQNVIGEELDRRGAHTHVATVLTQVAVDPKDPAFQHPTHRYAPLIPPIRFLQRQLQFSPQADQGCAGADCGRPVWKNGFHGNCVPKFLPPVQYQRV